MRRLLLVLMVFASPALLAADHDYELQFSPNFGWSNYETIFGLNASLLVPLNDHWQWKVGAGLTSYSMGGATFGLSSGLVYNFQTDWMDSFFAGAGLGYSSSYQLLGSDSVGHSTYAYAEFGKRFKLNASGTFAYAPSVSVSSNFHNGVELAIHPFNFTWSF
jgi:hypothetical protein